MKFTDLISAVPGAREPTAEAEIVDLTIDSRRVEPGFAFICVPGMHVDGHDYAKAAVESGAAALVVERMLPLDVPQALVPDARAAASHMAQKFFGYPARDMTMIGVTGTKGKTTTSFLIRAIMQAAGRSCGLIGTAMNIVGEETLPSTLTTPDPVDLNRLFRRMADQGVSACVMEVSAHALDMRRVDGLHFQAGVYTNFSQDHLDYFKGSMDAYFDAKKLFFQGGFCDWAAINADDERHELIRPHVANTTYAVSEPADAYARDIEIQEDGVSFALEWGAVRIPFRLKLSGLFNVYNALAAAVTCLHLGVPAIQVQEGLESVRGVPGRLEVIETDTPYRVYLDYAHSPDSLINILDTIRQFCRGRLICVFGCGGDRDREKRPVMGQIAGEKADITILTSDNPRNEDPEAILDAIEEGIQPTGGEYTRIENRQEAIAHALSIARDGDIVVLAGKGHEDYQDIKGKKYPFDERKIVKELLAGQ